MLKKESVVFENALKKDSHIFQTLKKESLIKMLCQFYTLLFDKVDKKRVQGENLC